MPLATVGLTAKSGMLCAMGLFDLFKAKKNPPAGAGAGASERRATSSWSQRFRGFRDLDEHAKLALCSGLLTELVPSVENGLVKPLPDDDEVELRGRLDGLPARVNLEFDMGWVRLEMKIANRVGTLALHRDHSKIPKHKSVNDDWADEDELRVFIAKGIFVEGQEHEVAEGLATVQSLPPPFVDFLTANMERLQMSRVVAGSATLQGAFEPDVYEMAEPARSIFDGLHVLKTTAQTLAQGQRDLGQATPAQGGVLAPPAPRVNCSYCSTLFLLGEKSTCPNCGAPYGT